jgi:hypothetical protein
MKDVFQDEIYQAMRSAASDNNQEAIALDREFLQNMGQDFGTDYVVRGRIIEFGTDQKDSFNPVRTGMIPFVFKSSKRTIFGVAESETYENIDVDQDLMEGYDRMRGFGWGAGQFVTGLIGDKEGRVNGATVQVRLLVQDAKTGEVVWLNRAEACSTPNSAFADQEPDTLIAKAIDQVISSLVADFASAFHSGRIAETGQVAEKEEAPIIAEPVTEKMDDRYSQEAKDAAEKAVKAADESKMYAQDAEKAAAEAKDSVKQASEASRKSEKIFEKIITK